MLIFTAHHIHYVLIFLWDLWNWPKENYYWLMGRRQKKFNKIFMKRISIKNFKNNSKITFKIFWFLLYFFKNFQFFRPHPLHPQFIYFHSWNSIIARKLCINEEAQNWVWVRATGVILGGHQQLLEQELIKNNPLNLSLRNFFISPECLNKRNDKIY